MEYFLRIKNTYISVMVKLLVYVEVAVVTTLEIIVAETL